MALLRRVARSLPRDARALSSPVRDELDMTFNSPKDAFKSKKTSELVRAYFVYQICSVNWLVENNAMLMKRTQQVVGKRIFEVLMSATFYGQFVAGEDPDNIVPTINRKDQLPNDILENITLHEPSESKEITTLTNVEPVLLYENMADSSIFDKHPNVLENKEQEELSCINGTNPVDELASFGVKSILDYSVEEDLSNEEAEKREVKASTSSLASKKEEGSLPQFQVDKKFADRRSKVHSARTYFYEDEPSCEKNKEHFIKSIDAVYNITKSSGLMAIKLTALGKPQLLLQLSEVIMKARNYMQQMGGGEGNVLTHKKTVEDLQRYLGDLSSKPEVQEFMSKVTHDKEGIVHLFPWSNILNEDLDLSDTFRVPDPKTGQMRRLISQISPEEEGQFRNMLKRLKYVIDYSNEKNVRIMIDAEQTYFQPAISRITLEMMNKYNRDKFLVFNTYQTYLKATHREILTDLEQAKRQKFNWAAKLVRGAYIEQERARAASMGYEDPTCPNVDATTASYHKCVKEVLSRVTLKNTDVGMMAASHNEDTVRFVIQTMKEQKIKPDDRIVCFGQLLGMCDHITFPLGQAGYSAYKYVPYGPVVEVLPYLSRRANENRGFLVKIKKEKSLLLKEILRRVFTGNMFYKPVGNYKPA